MSLSKQEVKDNPSKVIWLCDFHYREVIRTKGRGVVTTERNSIATNITSVGTDRIEIIRNPMFLKRVYQDVYDKDKWLKRYEEKTLTITKIDFKKPLSLSFAPEYN
jgi:hypothetical protein